MMSNAEEDDRNPQQSTSCSEDNRALRDDVLYAHSSANLNAMLKRRRSSATTSSRRPHLFSENGCGTVASQNQPTNHLTVECLVSVRAQVLTWDDALGGWLPLDDGSLCGVSLLQQVTCQQALSPSSVQPVKRRSWSGVLTRNTLTTPDIRASPQWEYHIQGKRISDQTVLLNCTLLPHVTYRNAMPTFHHWRIRDQRFGLSFGSAFDASKFHNRLQKALEHLCHQSKSGSAESNICASEELEDDVFAPTDLSDIFSSTSVAKPVTFNKIITETEATIQQQEMRKEHQSHSLPPVSLHCPIPIIRTTMSSSPVDRQKSIAFDECPPMDPEMARPSVIAHSIPSTNNDVVYVNVDTSGQQPQSEAHNRNEGNNTHGISDEEKGEEDELLITDDAISLPATLHQSFAISVSSSSKTDKTDSKGFDRRSLSRMRSKSRSEISSLNCRMPMVSEKMRSISNPGTDPFFTRNRYQHFERYVSSPLAVDGVRSFIETHASLYKNREHILLPKKKQLSSEMIRRECCFYCRNWYNVRDNRRGSCREAPDPIEIAIRRLTCYSVAQAAVYHCCKEDDEMPINIGRYGQGYNVCSCAPSNISRTKRFKRWSLLALISLLVPCLCCYLPAHYIYNCCCKGRRGRHKPCMNPDETDQLLTRRRNSRVMSRLSF